MSWYINKLLFVEKRSSLIVGREVGYSFGLTPKAGGRLRTRYILVSGSDVLKDQNPNRH